METNHIFEWRFQLGFLAFALVFYLISLFNKDPEEARNNLLRAIFWVLWGCWILQGS